MVLSRDQIEEILEFDGEVEVNLEEAKISLLYKKDGNCKDSGPVHIIPFEIEQHRRAILLEGLDEVAQTLRYKDKIEEFERKRLSDPGAAPPMKL